MKRNVTQKEKGATGKDMKSNLVPKQSTINFLLSYSRALHVEKLDKDKTIEMILN